MLDGGYPEITNLQSEWSNINFSESEIIFKIKSGNWKVVDEEQDPEVTIRQSEVDAYIDEINMLRELVAEITLQSDFNSLEQQAEAFRVLNDKMLSHQSYKQGDGGSTRIGELSKQLDVLFAAYDSLAGKQKEQTFKPISEMTLADWQQAMEEGAVFEYHDGSILTLSEVSNVFREPRVGFKEHSFLFRSDGVNLGSGYRIKRRIK
jgi:hypothetical protein